jgi:DNA-binding SARP family transcriptional activator
MLAQTSAPDVAGPVGSSLWIQVLGPMRIWRQGDEVELGPRQQRCIFALIMARAGQPIRMREIVDLVWAGNAPASAVNIVQKYVGGLRRLLEP